MDQTNYELETYQFTHISDAYDSAVNRIDAYRRGEIKPLHVGFPRLTKGLGGGVHESTIYVIGGRPGTGKSTICNRILFNICDCNDDQDFMILYWNFEMPNWQQVFREISAKQGYTMDDLRSAEHRIAVEEMAKIRSMKDLFSSYPLYFNNSPRSAEFIENATKKIYIAEKKKNPKIKLINVFDHSRLITSSNERDEEKRITKLFSMSHGLKIDYGISSIILSQLNRNIENTNRITNLGPVPQGSDFFGADSVQQYANVAMIIQSPDMYQGLGSYMGIPRKIFEGKAFLHIVKNRDGSLGWITYKKQFQNYQVEEYSKKEWKELVKQG